MLNVAVDPAASVAEVEPLSPAEPVTVLMPVAAEVPAMLGDWKVTGPKVLEGEPAFEADVDPETTVAVDVVCELPPPFPDDAGADEAGA